MDCQLSCTSPLPWIWVFEILTRSNQVDVSLLLDLVKKIPELSDDICRNARELVSLRILESIYAEGADANSKSSSSSPKIRLDLSERCEDVLQRILPETSSSNLKAAGAEMLQWDIQPFIAHKRSGLAKCSLQKLKDAILIGRHPLASLRERSGLPVGGQPDHEAPLNDGDCNIVTPRLEGNSNTQSCAANDQLTSPVLANGNYFLRGNLPDKNLLPAKRKISAPTENAERKSSKDQIILEDGRKTYIKTVKFKPDIISNEQDLGAKLVSSVIDLKIADASMTIVQSSEEERCSLGKETHVRGTEPKGLPGKNNIECPSSMGLAVPDEVLPCDKQYHHVDTEVPNDKSNEEHVQDHSVKEVNGIAKGLCEVKKVHKEMVTFVTDGQRNVPPIGEGGEHVYASSYSIGHEDDRTDVAAKENASFGQYSKGERCSSIKKTRVGGMVQNGLSGDGHNEVTSSKRLADHDEDLPCETEAPHYETGVPNDKFAEEQRQDYDNHNAECDKECFNELKIANKDVGRLDQNAQKIARIVSEAEEEINVASKMSDIATKWNAFLSFQCTSSQDSLATDERQLNLCVKCDKGDNLLFCYSNSCPLVIHEKCLGFDASFDTKGKFYCPFCAYSQAISKYMESKKKASLARNDLATFIGSGTGKESKEQQNHLEPNDGLPGSNELKNSDFWKNKRLEHKQAGPSVLGTIDSCHFGGEEVGLTTGVPHTLNEDKQEMKRTGKVSQSPRVHGQHEMALGISKSHGETTSCQVPRKSKRNAEIRSKKGVSCHQDTDLSREYKCSSDVEFADAEEISETESENSGSSKYFTRVQKQERKYSYPSFPQLKRKRRLWTSAEEEKLKEGMQKICSPDDKIIPWKKILEFGAGTFHKSRTTVDLKDKWRNIMKETSKS